MKIKWGYSFQQWGVPFYIVWIAREHVLQIAFFCIGIDIYFKRGPRS